MLGGGKRERGAWVVGGLVLALAIAAAAVVLEANAGDGSEPAAPISAATHLDSSAPHPDSSTTEPAGTGEKAGPGGAVSAEAGSGDPASGSPESRPADSGARADTARLTALERAAGLDPRKTKTVPWIPNEVRIKLGEALPCTGPKEPVNFDTFSAGPSVGDLELSHVVRRCGGTTPVDEPPANLVNYVYGTCEIAPGASGCAPPLEIQTWPACERALADYVYDGKPMPYRRLPNVGGAEVVVMMDGRIEVYTKSSTIVIFAQDPLLAEEALALLRSQQQPDQNPEKDLAPPSDGAVEGELPCRQS